jgi:SAM-dependent methyltransferase
LRDAGWSWDETLFAGSAKYYRAGRLPYPPDLVAAFQQELGLDGTGRLLDVGTGTGEIALLLAPLYETVVGLDPDAGMLAEARAEATRRELANATWVHARAEDLPLGLGSFRTATFAQSFHWMDRRRVAATLFEMLEPGGAWVHVDTKTHRGAPTEAPLEHPQPPRDELEALVARYLGPVRRAGQGALRGGTPSGESEIMSAAGFAGPHTRTLEGGRVVERSEDEVVASIFSVSGSAPHLFGERLAEFERDARDALREVSPDGRFCEVTDDARLIVWTRVR